MSQIINLLDWDITYEEFVTWISDTDSDVYVVASRGAGDPRTMYLFENDEDFAAFKLKFPPDSPNVMGYKDRSDIMNDVSYYYAPYIPEMMKITDA